MADFLDTKTGLMVKQEIYSFKLYIFFSSSYEMARNKDDNIHK